MQKTKATRTTEQVLKQQKADAAKGNTAIVKKATNALAADTNNPWITVGAELNKILGAPLLKFNKQGEFALSDVDVIPGGTRCIVHADEMTPWSGSSGAMANPTPPRAGLAA